MNGVLRSESVGALRRKIKKGIDLCLKLCYNSKKGEIKMRKVKRFVLLMVVTFLLVSTLSGCIIPIFKRFDIAPRTVSSIQIYDLRQSESRFSDEFLQTETPVYEISKVNHLVFFNDLSKIRFYNLMVIMAASKPKTVYGDWTVRINYTNGSYQLLSCERWGQTFNSNGDEQSYHFFTCKEEKWLALISKYVPEKIFNNSQESN